MAAAGVLLAAMAVGTVAGEPAGGRARVALAARAARDRAAGRRRRRASPWPRWPPARLELLGLALLIPGAAIGVLFTTTYLVADRLSHEGTGTQTFAWLVTANNGGIGFGAAVGGVLSEASGAAAGLWFAAICALVGAIPAAATAALSARGPNPPQNGGFTGVTSDKRRINAPQGNGESGEGP